MKLRRSEGMTIVELLVAVSIIGIMTVMGGVLTTKAFLRRQADFVTTNISSQLQLMKFSALRKGVEHSVDLTYEPGCIDVENRLCNLLTITTSRGNSNRSSTVFLPLNTVIVRVPDSMAVDIPAPVTYIFRPDGRMAAGGGTLINVFPTAGSRQKRCGEVIVNNFGRVSVTEGNWNTSGSYCREIQDVVP